MTRMHYASRTMEGVEMARIAARDLRRRLPGGDNCDAASRNPTVKIDLSGRKLTDEGFEIFIDALLETLQKEKDDKHPEGFVRLLKLQLGGNCLTFKSLPKLGMAIRLSTGDLSDLSDLSQNCIEVSTAGQKAAWKYFLNSFGECYMLKRVNFSGNPLGAPGVEILARVYIRSRPEFPDQRTGFPEEGDDSGVDQSEDQSSDDNGPGVDRFSSLSIYDNGQNSAHSGDQDPTPQPQGPSEIASKSNRRHFRKTRGLRSVPELILTEIPMSSIGVIHLASILYMQESREFLCFYLPKTKADASRPETEKKNPSITWHLNEHLPQCVRQAPYWATEIAQLGLSFDSSLAVAIDNLESPSSGFLRGGRSWKEGYEMKFRPVGKALYAPASESEIRGSEIWTMALKMAKMMETVLFNEEVIQAQLSSAGKVFECLGLQRDLVDAINIGVFRSRQLLDGQSQEPWRLGMSLDIWSDIMGMALDKGDVLTAQQRMNILGYVGRGNRRVPEKAMETWRFLFDVDCVMYHAS